MGVCFTSRNMNKPLPTPLVVLAALSVSFLLIFILLFVDDIPESEKRTLQQPETSDIFPGFKGVDYVANVPIPYKTRRHSIQGTSVDIFWYDVTNPQGILFLFHGCSHKGEDWFTLPEETHFITTAIQQKILPVAFSSQDASHGLSNHCWDHNPPTIIPDIQGKNKDLGPIAGVIAEMIKTNYWDIPIILLGTSSGAQFVSMLPKQLGNEVQVHSIMLYINPGVRNIFEEIPNIGPSGPAKFPKVGFLAMERDENTLQRILDTQSLLAGKSVQTKLWKIGRPIIYPTFFSDNTALPLSASEEIYEILLRNSFLDNEGYLVRNPRSSNWLEIVSQSFSQPPTLQRYEEHIRELLNVAFGYHEFTSEAAANILQWNML